MEYRVKQVSKNRFFIEENKDVKIITGILWWKKTTTIKQWGIISNRVWIGIHAGFLRMEEPFKSAEDAQARIIELKIDYPIYHSAMADSPV